MKRLMSLAIIVSIVVMWPVKILAASVNHIVISEIQTGSASDASQEFVELYNPTNTVISLDAWTIEYASSAGTSWTKRATLSGSIPAYGFYLISTVGYLSADVTMSSGLASTSGHVRIKNGSGVVIDVVGWGSAAHAEGSPTAAPVVGGSIERAPGRLSQLAGNGEDSDNNATDFVARETPEPQKVSSVIEDPSLVPPQGPDPEPVDEGVVTTPTYLPIYITEALPDPASPLTDAKDEFIELFNPNDSLVNLKGYILRTGTDFKSYYSIGDITIAPGEYKAFYSADTKLGLTNSGGAVQILDPLGNVLDVTDGYGAAKVGQAWADINGTWMWTQQPTPMGPNILTEPIPKTVVTTSAKSTTKKASTKKPTVKKASAKKVSKAKAAKKAKSKKLKTSIAAATTAITEPSPLARWLLIGAGCFTIMYAIYGFRHDLYNYYIKTRRNIGARVQNRPTLPWRRNHRAGK